MKQLVYFFMAFALWMLLVWSTDMQEVIAGIIVAIAVTMLLSHLYFDHAEMILDPRRIFWFVWFMVIFFIHMIRANIDVAYRVLHLNVPIRPGIVEVTSTLSSDIGLTMLANAITLTPGTLTVDIIGNKFFIHWIYVADDNPEHQTGIIVSRFESILKKVFE